MNAQRVIRHVVVRGRVQGVGFRAHIEYHALKHGLEGWVRNRRDGSVEALFAGLHETVAAAIAATQEGPPSGRVDALDQRDGSETELALRQPGEDFSVLPTI
jgi:acylphosphatase